MHQPTGNTRTIGNEIKCCQSSLRLYVIQGQKTIQNATEGSHSLEERRNSGLVECQPVGFKVNNFWCVVASSPKYIHILTRIISASVFLMSRCHLGNLWDSCLYWGPASDAWPGYKQRLQQRCVLQSTSRWLYARGQSHERWWRRRETRFEINTRQYLAGIS